MSTARAGRRAVASFLWFSISRRRHAQHSDYGQCQSEYLKFSDECFHCISTSVCCYIKSFKISFHHSRPRGNDRLGTYTALSTPYLYSTINCMEM